MSTCCSSSHLVGDVLGSEDPDGGVAPLLLLGLCALLQLAHGCTDVHHAQLPAVHLPPFPLETATQH